MMCGARVELLEEIVNSYHFTFLAFFGCLAAVKRKEESPDCAATRLGDFILCPHGLAISFLPNDIIVYAFY